MSEDGKTQSIEACEHNASSNSVMLMPDVVTLNLTGSKRLDNLNCSNSNSLTAIMAPNLTSVGTITLRNLPNLTAIEMPVLWNTTNATMDSIGNSTMPGFLNLVQTLSIAHSELDRFTVFFGEIANISIVNNTQLEALQLPLLKRIGGNLYMSNNTKLSNLTASFTALEEVGDAVQISGNISSLVPTAVPLPHSPAH